MHMRYRSIYSGSDEDPVIFKVEVTRDIHKGKLLQAASLENQFESFEHRAAV